MSKKIQSIRCNLCGSGRYYLVYKTKQANPPVPAYQISESHLEKPSKIMRCMVCGLVFAAQDMTSQSIEKSYEDLVDPDYVSEEKGRGEQAKLILAKISKFKKTGKLLEIGCGPGFLLNQAKRQGWNVSGVELSLWAQKYAQERFDVSIQRGTLFEAAFPDRFFDVIVMTDLIEHVQDPHALLTEVRRILRNDGIIYISTPDINSVLSRMLKAQWWGINKYHLFYFSKKTLELFFEKTGFRKTCYFSYPRVFSFNYWNKRLKPYPFFVRFPLFLLSRLGAGERLLKVVLHDQLAVIARKSKMMDSFASKSDAGNKQGPLKKAKVIAVLPAYNAARTLQKTVEDIPAGVVDEIILVDDASWDDTFKIAKKLGLTSFRHASNKGYGANQKTCYEKALEAGADIVVMLHPDYQYDPKIIPQLIGPILNGQADAVFGSRIMKGGALEGGMPLWKYNANILLTAFENIMLGTYLTEYHTGFRAYSAPLLRRIAYQKNSDGFIFDTEIIVQIVHAQLKIEEIPIETRYFEEASSIKLGPSIVYGLGILWTMFLHFLHVRGLFKIKKFEPLKESNATP